MNRKQHKWPINVSIIVGIGILIVFIGYKYLNKNKYEKLKSDFIFTKLIDLSCTSVKDQGASNTCWSYTGNSFLESEMMRLGKKAVAISPIYTARMAYMERARSYVRLQGNLSLGEGGQLHDVIHTLRENGALPMSVYTGLIAGKKQNDFKEMRSVLNSMLKVMVKSKSVRPSWEQVFSNTMDNYLGKVPSTFEYEGKIYTPKTFADQVIDLPLDDYISIASVTHKPYYSPFVLLVPDNWAFSSFYNVPMKTLTDIIDEALKTGHTVAWTTDVSEPGFSWKHGIAFVPKSVPTAMSNDKKDAMYLKPQSELSVTSQMRQKALDLWYTTDDHAMHIVGLAKDQYGKEYYLAKNSWGTHNALRGYMHVTKEYVRYKTTAIMLHKNAIGADLKQKLLMQ